MDPKCFLFLLPDLISVFVQILCASGRILCVYSCGLESVRKKKKRRTQRNVSKAEEVPEHINFSNRGAFPFFSDQCLR